MKINQIIRERSQQDDGCPPCPPAAPPAKQRDGVINHPMVNKALTPHWLTNLIPGVNATQTVAKAARDLVNAISDKDPRALAAAVASAPSPLQAAAGTANQAMGAYDTVKKDGPGMLSKIQSYNPFRSRSGPPAPIEDRIAKPVPAQPYSQRVGEILGDTVGTVTTVPDASGKIKIKTPTGTEIETNKDALLPGAKPGTVQMKPDAAGDALKPGTQVVSAEAMGSEVDPDKLMASMDVAGERKEFDLTPFIAKNNWVGDPKTVIKQADKWLGDFLRSKGLAYSNLKISYKGMVMNASQLGDPGQMEDIRRMKELAGVKPYVHAPGPDDPNFERYVYLMWKYEFLDNERTGKANLIKVDVGVSDESNAEIDRLKYEAEKLAGPNLQAWEKARIGYRTDPEYIKYSQAMAAKLSAELLEDANIASTLPAAVPAPAQPQVDPANYKVPSVDFFKKNYKHPADVIDGSHPSTSDPTRIGAWQGGSDFADLMMALSGSYYQARQADPNFKQPAFVKDDWELVQRMLGTPEGKEYAIDQSIGLSNIDDKSPDAEFNRAQHKEFEKQANARAALGPTNTEVTPGWKYDQKLGMTPAQAELQAQKAKQQPAALAPVSEGLSKFLSIVRKNDVGILKEAELNQKPASVAPLPQLKVPPIPQLPAQDGDLGNGKKVQTNPDGTRSYKSEAGTYTYDAQGKAITYTSPSMSGFGQTLDLTTNEITLDYHAGPLSTTAKTDAQGRGTSFGLKYNLGGGQYHSLDKEIDHASGITSNTFTPAGGVDPNKLLPTAAIAGARGVDPKKFAAFQQQNPTAVKESADDKLLKQMLSIARLR